MADSYTPPQDVRATAKRALEWRREYNRGGTEVGVASARPEQWQGYSDRDDSANALIFCATRG
jgi:hypothetical protein